MKKLLILLFCGALVCVAGCYTPQGGTSIPWNEPQPGEGSFTPRMNF